jgi:hypothetical protein
MSDTNNNPLSPQELNVLLKDLIEQTSNNEVAIANVVPLLNHLMNRGDAQILFDSENVVLASSLWDKFTRSGVALPLPPILKR